MVLFCTPFWHRNHPVDNPHVHFSLSGRSTYRYLIESLISDSGFPDQARFGNATRSTTFITTRKSVVTTRSVTGCVWGGYRTDPFCHTGGSWYQACQLALGDRQYWASHLRRRTVCCSRTVLIDKNLRCGNCILNSAAQTYCKNQLLDNAAARLPGSKNGDCSATGAAPAWSRNPFTESGGQRRGWCSFRFHHQYRGIQKAV